MAVNELDAIKRCIETTVDTVIHAENMTAARDGFITPGPAQETWMSDELVPKSVEAALIRQVDAMAAVIANERNLPEDPISVLVRNAFARTPDSQSNPVVDPTQNIHVTGKSRNVPSTVKPDPTRSISVVERAQWATLNATETTKGEDFVMYNRLPTDFAIDDNGHVIIRSYINNLHPIKYAGMYQSIASIFERFVPLFDRVLSAVANDSPSSTLNTRYLRSDQQEKNHKAGYLPAHPEIPESLPLEPKCIKTFTIKGRTVQVIVEVTEVRLTPSNTTYHGEYCTYQGTSTERVVASGVYCFDSKNVTSPSVSFDAVVWGNEELEVRDLKLAPIYGIDKGNLRSQKFGTIAMQDGLCLVFPDSMMHSLGPFKLEDTSMSGSCKMLAFFLLHPDAKMIST